jgi:hypothetical protein
MEAADVGAWFDEYLSAFAACGRGESDDVAGLLRYYGAPLLLTSDAGVLELTTDDDVVAAIRPQIDGMRAARYDRSEVLDRDVVVLNATSALLTAGFSRRRADGGEIGRLRATYLIADGPAGRRIHALTVRSG